VRIVLDVVWQLLLIGVWGVIAATGIGFAGLIVIVFTPKGNHSRYLRRLAYLCILAAVLLPSYLYYLESRRANLARREPAHAAAAYVDSLDPDSWARTGWFLLPGENQGLYAFGSDLARRTIGKFGSTRVAGGRLDYIRAEAASGSVVADSARIVVEGNYSPRTGSTRRTYLFTGRSFTVVVYLRHDHGQWLVRQVACLRAEDLRCDGFGACVCPDQ
jgi:hypothetical protein